jgi:hypothetical protein
MKAHFGTLLVVAAVLLAIQSTQSSADPVPRDQWTSYVVQDICVDGSGRSTDALPIDPQCQRSRPQWSRDPATYRKHDWPDSLDAPQIAGGYQASDSVLQQRGSRVVVVQTFDFGTDGRRFGRFDGGRGDGGQVLVFVDKWASFVMTEDGGAGVQWFVGEGCRTSRQPDARYASWLVFGDDVTPGAWGSAVARLNIAAEPGACPRRFNDAYTRYRLDEVELPFRVIRAAPKVMTSRHRLDVLVSEHFGGSAIRSADHLERFFLAKGLGLVRWERWANGNLPQPRALTEGADKLAQTARCPRLERYGAPEPNWRLVDCRTWTTLVHQASSWSVDQFNWPALNGLGAPR